ncbi:MAG: hypothetical protein AB1744_02035 [Candidatus Zixiibacteriota bacterium]
MDIGSVPGEQPDRQQAETGRTSGQQGRDAHLAGPNESALETRRRLAELADSALHNEWQRRHEGSARLEDDKAGGAYSPESEHRQRAVRIARARQRMLSGFYDRPDVKKTIADKLASKFGRSIDKDSDRKR